MVKLKMIYLNKIPKNKKNNFGKCHVSGFQHYFRQSVSYIMTNLPILSKNTYF